MEGGRTAEAGTSSSTSHSPMDEAAAAAVAISGAHAEEAHVGDEVDAVEGDDDDHGHEEEEASAPGFVPGPLIPLKDHLERDKHDESLKRWKEKLLGCLEGELNDEMEPQVTFHSIGIVSEGYAETTTALPRTGNKSHTLFTLKEGSIFRLKLTFSVKNNIVSGLTYSNTVWKSGFQVDRIKGMLGTFAPRREPYSHMLDEEKIPSGVLARGTYLAKLKFEDDDKRCHMELDYSFEIKKR